MTLQILLYDRKTGLYLHEIHENRCNKQYTFLKRICNSPEWQIHFCSTLMKTLLALALCEIKGRKF